MIYLLIDTNCWIELLTSDPNGESLQLLEFWVRNEHICLLMPEEIKDREWPNQHEKQLKEIKSTNECKFW